MAASARDFYRSSIAQHPVVCLQIREWIMETRSHCLKTSLITAVVAIACFVTPRAPASAAATDGVRCPNGVDAAYDTGAKVMRCSLQTVLHRPTVCDTAFPVFFVYRAAKGRDFCVRPVDATATFSTGPDNDSRKKSAVCTADASDGARWQLEPDGAGDERDRCKSVRVEWIYPSQQ